MLRKCPKKMTINFLLIVAIKRLRSISGSAFHKLGNSSKYKCLSLLFLIRGWTSLFQLLDLVGFWLNEVKSRMLNEISGEEILLTL